MRLKRLRTSRSRTRKDNLRYLLPTATYRILMCAYNIFCEFSAERAPLFKRFSKNKSEFSAGKSEFSAGKSENINCINRRIRIY